VVEGLDHRRKTILLTAIEPSADVIGADLIEALRDRLGSETRFIGVGGSAMARCGFKSLFDPSALAVVGAANALGAYAKVLRGAGKVGALARVVRPDVAVLIDSWGFSLRAARQLRAVDPTVPLIKYIGPQVWATRPGRAKTLAKVVDRLLTIHTFDAPIFERAGLPTRFVGNPALDRAVSSADGDAFRQTRGIEADRPVLLLAPGSRKGEVNRLMPVFRETAARLATDWPRLVVVCPVAEPVADLVRTTVSDWPIQVELVFGDHERWSAMNAATVALACSGTVTTELALANCPMVVAYRLDLLTYGIAKALIRTPYVTLFNVAAGKAVAKERLQGDCNATILTEDIGELLADPTTRSVQREAQSAALQAMRGDVGDAIAAAADAIVETIEDGPV